MFFCCCYSGSGFSLVLLVTVQGAASQVIARFTVEGYIKPPV